jgi:hypothetical protein
VHELVETGHFCLLVVFFFWKGKQADKAIKDGMEGIVESRILREHSFTDESLQRRSVFGIRKPCIWLICDNYLKDICCT